MLYSALEEAHVSISPFFFFKEQHKRYCYERSRNNIIFGSAEEEGRGRGEGVEKSEVYEKIFPKTNLTKEMRRGG